MGRKKAIKIGPNKPIRSSGKRITPIPVHPTSPGKIITLIPVQPTGPVAKSTVEVACGRDATKEFWKDFEEANANSPSVSRTLGEEDTDDATSIGAP
ncbi:Hypothetical predicted protein [Olea europaea subsp. europaea]|uniref:Uncharacterized protein n=1 Tax=Olea europaea subsp. europaea TaxID=158383 RepID=A0A8S0TTG1_OLEEU|nr:Hypothetical predicted protein [Olea europaea subsp. europaea]